jgi:hypothetical protein
MGGMHGSAQNFFQTGAGVQGGGSGGGQSEVQSVGDQSQPGQARPVWQVIRCTLNLFLQVSVLSLVQHGEDSLE